MIVRRTDDHLLLITQPDHAALAETLMSAWAVDGLPVAAHRQTVLFATRHHDDGWIDEDRSPLVDPATGRLLDFTDTPDEVRHRIWPRGIEKLASVPYAAALVAEHAIHLHDRHRTNPEWREFFTEVERARNRHLAAAASLDEADLRRDYFFVRMGDLLSLIFCNGWSDPHHEGAYRAQLDGSRLRVSPDPFRGREVRMAISARQLRDQVFHSRREASAAFTAAPVVMLSGVASGP